MFIVELIKGVAPVVLIVRVEFFEKASLRLTVAGLKTAVAPAGKPLALRITLPVKPANGVTVTVY